MKNKFIKSTLILIIGGGVTKLLAMIIKIFLTRSIGDKGIGLYMMILPTFNLFITLSTLSLSTSISKIISKGTSTGRKVILSIIPISILYNFILMFLLIFLSPVIANFLLKNSLTTYPIMAIGFTLPFICISNILKGYFYGRENMFPFVLANNIEQLVRMFLIIFIVPKLIRFGIVIQVCFVVGINIFSEGSSIVTMLLFIKKKTLEYKDFKFDKSIFKEIMDISIPTTGSRLIGSISYFLEPVILTFVLLHLGYSNSYITMEYGIITGYAYPVLLLPSFFTMAISTSLLPVISNSFSRGKYEYSKKKLKQGLYISIFIGIFFTIIFMLFPSPILKLVFNTNNGANYVRMIAPVFILYYIQGPLTAYLQAIDKSDIAMKGTLVGVIIKNILLLILPYFVGIYGFIIATAINIIYVTLQHGYYTIKSFR